jgi:hypothetical protein
MFGLLLVHWQTKTVRGAQATVPLAGRSDRDDDDLMRLETILTVHLMAFKIRKMNLPSKVVAGSKQTTARKRTQSARHS